MKCLEKSLVCLEADHRKLTSQVFDGLILTSSGLKLDETFFRCCGAKGVSFAEGSSDDGRGTGNVVFCDLNKKFSRVQKIYSKYKKIFPTKNLAPISDEQVLFLIDWAEKLGFEKNYGQAIQVESSDNSIMWTIAMLFTWHVGLNPRTVFLEKEFESQIFDDIEQHEFVLLDGVSKLWEPSELLKLDRLVNYCYGAEIPLWVFFPKVKLEKNSRLTRGMRKFEKKIFQLKSKSPLSHLPRSTYGKLQDICLGLERIPKQ